MKKLILNIFLLLPTLLLAQQPFTLKNAIDSALKNNLDIQLASNNVTVNKLNNTFGMAGMLPILNIGGTDNETYSNIYLKQASGTIIQKDNVGGNALALGLNAGITLFNGFKVYATKSRLESLQKQSELILNQQVQNTMASVMTKYYDIIRQQGYLQALQMSMDLSQKKLDVISERRKAGMANDADYLQAQVDLNSAKQNVETQKITVEQTKIDLFQLINAKTYRNIEVKDTIIIDNKVKFDSVVSGLKQNQQVQALEEQEKINQLMLKEITTQYYPSLKFNTGYNVALTKSDAGTILVNKNIGPYLGVSLQVPIFNATVTKTQHDVAEISLKNVQLQKESLSNSLSLGATKTWDSFNTYKSLIDAQVDTKKLADKMMMLVFTRFQVGQSTVIDLKTAQASFENVNFQLISMQYAAKIAEIELKRLSYSLKY